MSDEEESFFGTKSDTLAEEIDDLKKKETSQLELVWKRFKRNKLALLGAGIILSLIFVAIFAPFIAPYDPLQTHPDRIREDPSREHLLGTDQVGRDTLSRLIFGTRIALFIGLLIVAVSGSIGVTLGLIAGTYGGWVDEIIMRTVDTFLSFPVLIFALAISVALGTGLYPVIIATGLIIWTEFARVTRGEVLSIKKETYIESAMAIGEKKGNIILRYFLPNILPSIVVVATIQMPAALLYSATLNFLGIGAQPPVPSWGQMVRRGSEFMQFYPYLALFASLAIVITVLGFNFIGDGLRDALDPVRGGS